ncbi:kunitz-type trypsin inhibitor KTI1-like [Vigna radiata var. radiata]|uniref:Kunitz-type trypsin inhibitor KTI1-like n=1 Tax=Vigna radiata var. radiata TaxID=3916 RepID=A0A1S3UL75_VIGRR|nr:kunitz-type trypsin inhibitor KTI1-like [Vigna radiata var. radiata]
MKFTTFLSLFLLCAFTSNLPSASGAVVVDTDGYPIENGDPYFITPVIITGNGGGVEFAATGNETCALSVVQNPNPLSKGFPIHISSPLKIRFISEGTILTLGFLFVPPCAPTPSLWTPVKFEEEELPVKLTGYDNTVSGWFEIQSVPVDIGGYNILFCPLDGSSCGYVGIQFDAARNRHLVVTQKADTALWVRFQRLSSASSAISPHEPSLLLKSHV